ncbi:MAG TPA: hypothetical protein EYQ64_00985 [Gemmatimonadetes bacterium]|nr:hypothetical protein [Gemmatimonadota bacterium]
MSDGPFKRFVREIHRRSLWQVLGIYLVTSWAVLSAVDTLGGALNLPEWFPSVASALLVVGLPIVLATAFLQEGGPGHDMGDVGVAGPTAPPSGTSFLFTWRNAFGGGVLAFALLVLAMGHSAPEEVLVLIPEARRYGVEKILVTHVFSQRPTRAQMQQMADTGAILEIDSYAVYLGNRTVAEYASAIREIGAEHFLMSSDLGQATSPPHVDGLRAYIRAFRDAGVTDDEIDVMLRHNPARLLGLEP